MFGALCSLLDRLVQTGDLTIVAADGRERAFGDGSGRPVRLQVHSPSVYKKLVFDPQLYLGEAYMDGLVSFEEGNVYEFSDPSCCATRWAKAPLSRSARSRPGATSHANCASSIRPAGRGVM